MNFSLQPKKSLGQNFLIDKNIINKIISIAAIKENQTILEIGAGSGNLTEILAINRTNKVYAIEKDKKLSLYLKKKFQTFENVNVILGMYHDQVLTPFKALFKYNAINITLGLPYNRVSPDHGVAKDIIGKKIANPESLIRSVEFFNFINS